jgi:very-short-patch-repair endonuclease
MYREDLKPYAQKLRKDMTPEERKLWYKFLQPLPILVYRQKPFGNYIADFYCPKAKVVVEVDGSQHYDEEGLRHDCERDRYFNSLEITVLRYSNLQINKHFKEVCEDLYRHIMP